YLRFQLHALFFAKNVGAPKLFPFGTPTFIIEPFLLACGAYGQKIPVILWECLTKRESSDMIANVRLF
ncbi:hypothetical protein, partial [Thermoclostridium caenicola]|uniref:hypothetical protein n=1 Tax=Thermoclostridium caenicola TaxID=659425 RepID=UPI001A9AA0BF